MPDVIRDEGDDDLQVATGTGGPAGPGAEADNAAQPGDAMPGNPKGAQSEDGASLPSEMEGKDEES